MKNIQNIKNKEDAVELLRIYLLTNYHNHNYDGTDGTGKNHTFIVNGKDPNKDKWPRYTHMRIIVDQIFDCGYQQGEKEASMSFKIKRFFNNLFKKKK